MVSSLDPSALNDKDLVDLSDHVLPRIHFKHSPTGVSFYKPWFGRKGGRNIPFPSGTRGFLYFHRSYEHAAAAEIRFRIIRPEDVHLPATEAFTLGSDLISASGITPWRLHILNVFHFYPMVRDQLLAEGLVSGPQAAQINAILASGSWTRSSILENITDPFIWSPRSPSRELVILHQEGEFRGKLYFYLANPRLLADKMCLQSGTKSGNDFAYTHPRNWQAYRSTQGKHWSDSSLPS
jgi:hypothetical protein